MSHELFIFFLRKTARFEPLEDNAWFGTIGMLCSDIPCIHTLAEGDQTTIGHCILPLSLAMRWCVCVCVCVCVYVSISS